MFRQQELRETKSVLSKMWSHFIINGLWKWIPVRTLVYRLCENQCIPYLFTRDNAPIKVYSARSIPIITVMFNENTVVNLAQEFMYVAE